MLAVTLKMAVPPAQAATLTGCTLITGNCASNTVMVNVQFEVLPHASVAVEVTVVVPTEKLLPDAGELVMVTVPQLSVAVTVKFTGTLHEPTVLVTVILAGQVMVGAV